MSITDKLLNLMKLNDDDDYDDDYDEEEEVFENEQRPSRRSQERSMNSSKEASSRTSINRNQESRNASGSSSHGRSKAVSMKNRNGLEVCVIRPSAGIDDCAEITATLLSGKAVVINLEGIPSDTAQRVIDFTSGSCTAIDGNLSSVSPYIFIASPPNVDISGDLQTKEDNSASLGGY